MKRRMLLAAVCVSLFVLPFSASAFSDWTGVYARVDRVVFEPSESAAQRIQIWGAFALAVRQSGSAYAPAQRGYLYFSIVPGKEETCRKEWADLKKLAGSGEIVGFGARHLDSRLRKADEKPSSPDSYPVSSGLVRMNSRSTDYAPIKELRSLPRGQN